jgi:hypothetical protein
MKHPGKLPIAALLIAALMLGLALVAITTAPVSASGSSAGATPAVVPASNEPAVPASAGTIAPPDVETPTPAICNQLLTENNDPQYAQFLNHVSGIARGAAAAGLPNAAEHLPYAGPIPDQTVDGVAMAGSQLSAECQQGLQATSQTDPSGVAYNGQSDVSGLVDHKLDSNSVAGILTVNSQTQNFYPGSGTPTQWGGQENVVLPNVTIRGSNCPTAACKASSVSSGNYAFWVQNVISYDSFNDTISFVDDTWNFTTSSSDMFSNSLLGWSPNGGNYTGVWVAYSPYYYAPPPFTVTAYVNTSVNSAGDQILWYNYSIDDEATHTFIGNGNYDYLIFDSQPSVGGPVAVNPPDFEASAITKHEVTEGYEFDAFIGADDGSNNLILNVNGSMQVQYCIQVPYCTPTSFAYANVPAAVDIGSQTGEQSAGIGVSFNPYTDTANLTSGPLISHGLWGYSGQTGVEPGSTEVYNWLSVSGDPLGTLTQQPYIFIFLENNAYASQGYQWVPDVPVWYLMPGTYSYEVMLSDYNEVTGTLTVGPTGSAPVAFQATLSYNPLMGVYTPLWALNNSALAGISQSGAGTIGSQYVPFNNPTTSYDGFTPGNLSANFYSSDDYHFPTFTGVLFDGTNAYVDLNNPPSFDSHVASSRGVTTYYYLGFEFFETSHVTLANDPQVRGWPNWEEIDFYISVPASQNPAPQAEVFVWNSTSDLIMSNTFIGTAPGSGYVAPDGLVLYGGSNNTVWGNTFEDPIHTALGSSYAGIGLADEHDLIYNNNFSVDNPVVYLPYNWDNVADCLPQSLGGCGQRAPGNGFFYNDLANVVGETWNVTPQAASNVANTINGFPLSGNVLGPLVTTQGGNYYWNLGQALNPLSTTPYVDQFNYTDWSNIFPLGCGSIEAPGAPCGTAPPIVSALENGIQVGGDYAAYGPTVLFTETGLVAGTQWSVSLNGGTPTTSSSTSLSLSEAYGTYTYSVTPVPGYTQSVTTGSVLISGEVHISVIFHQVTYAVSFSESGLPSGDTWYINITSGPSLSATGATTTLTTSLPNGTYDFSIATNDNTYAPSYYAGSVSVTGAAVSAAPIAFTLVTYPVQFSETGLPGGTSWTATLGGTPQTTTSSSVTFHVINGSYAYSIASSNPQYAPNVYSGGVLVSGTGQSVAITFSPVTYAVTFSESGLPAGATWYVNVTGGPDLSATGATTALSTSLMNGTYPFSVATNEKTYSPAYADSSVTVNGEATSAGDSFALVTYAVTFTETGLPTHTSWSVTINAATQSSTGTSMVFEEANATYGYTLSTALGGSFTGSTTVNGGPVTVATAFHGVKFVESGLPAGTSWQVTTNSVTLTSVTTSIQFYLVDSHTYAYTVGLISGYHTTDHGSFTLVGTSISVSVPFKLTTYAVKFTESGFTNAWKTTWCVTLGATTTCVTGVSSISFTGIVNGTYSYTIGNVANYTLNGGAYTGSVTVTGAGQGSTAVTTATHWTLVKYTVKFQETGLPHGTSWQVSVDGQTKVTTSASMSFTLSNGTYAFTAISTGHPNVTGTVTVDGSTVTESVTFS